MDDKKVKISEGIFVDNDLHAPKRLTPLGKSYTTLVKILKYSFSFAAILVFGALIAKLSGTDQAPQTVDPTKKEIAKTTPGQIEVVGAKYEGVDEKGNPYTITADKANRSAKTEDDGILFDNPVTDIVLGDKTWLALKAAGGFFNRFSENIMMEDGVIAYHDSGYEINMRNIIINLKDKSGSTASPVYVQGPMGSASAQNMEVKAGGETIILGGPINIKIFDLSLIKG